VSEQPGLSLTDPPLPCPHTKTRPVQALQNQSRDHPPGGDDVCPVPALAAQCRGPGSHERGIDVSHESVRFWWRRFGPKFASEIRKRRAERLRAWPQWRWHLDEVFVKINGEAHYLWRTVDHEGEVLESFATKTRDKRAALEFLKKAMLRHGQPGKIGTDKLRSYRAALRELGIGDRPLEKQPRGELALAFSKARTGNAALQANAKPSEVSSLPFTPLSTISSTRNAASLPDRISS